MSWIKNITIWCDGDGCGEWRWGETNESVTESRKMLKKNGWKHRNGKDYCPDCADKQDRRE